MLKGKLESKSAGLKSNTVCAGNLPRDQPSWIVIGSCDITCQCLLLQRFPRTTSCLLKLYFIAWSLSNRISLKEKIRYPHEGSLLGLGRNVKAALKRNYTHKVPWILSLWNPIPFVACFWQTESILRMGQGSFKGIPASKTESHFQKQIVAFFYVRLGRYDNWVQRLWAWQEWDMGRYFSKRQFMSYGVLIFKTSKSFLVVASFLFLLLFCSTSGWSKKIFFKIYKIDI